MLLEADICGGGPSGRNGGFATSWWDELPTLIERHGATGAVAVAEAMDDAVDEIGAWCAANGVDAWYRKAGSLSASAAPAQDDAWEEAVAACAAVGSRRPLRRRSTADEVAARVHSPGAARRRRSCPAPRRSSRRALARGLRRVAAGARRRHPRGHDGRRDRRPAPGRGSGALGRRRLVARPSGGPGRRPAPVRIRTRSAAGDGEVLAGAAIVGLNAWAAAWPCVRPAARDVVVATSC